MQFSWLCVCHAASANPQQTLLCAGGGSSKRYYYTDWYVASMCFPASPWSKDQCVKSPKCGAEWEAGKPHKHLKAVNENSQYIVLYKQMVTLPARNIKKVRWGKGERIWGEARYSPQMGSKVISRPGEGELEKCRRISEYHSFGNHCRQYQFA